DPSAQKSTLEAYSGSDGKLRQSRVFATRPAANRDSRSRSGSGRAHVRDRAAHAQRDATKRTSSGAFPWSRLRDARGKTLQSRSMRPVHFTLGVLVLASAACSGSGNPQRDGAAPQDTAGSDRGSVSDVAADTGSGDVASDAPSLATVLTVSSGAGDRL